mmetsp:Transcript_11853/g.37656  ORF Transcript_11853/g.37656 Transcript_11853/m.37656 type:complete len:397 (+) Transcript_11853:42-1232(+)
MKPKQTIPIYDPHCNTPPREVGGGCAGRAPRRECASRHRRCKFAWCCNVPPLPALIPNTTRNIDARAAWHAIVHANAHAPARRRVIPVGHLVLDDLLENLHEHLRPPRLPHRPPRHPHVEDVGPLLKVVLDVLIAPLGALVGQVREPHPLRGEHLVQVEHVERGRRGLPQRRGEDRGLQRRQRRLELRGDEGERRLLHVELLVQPHRLGHQARVELEEGVVEEGREVPREGLALLQAAAEALGQGLGVGQLLVFGHVGLVGIHVVQLDLRVPLEPAEEEVHELVVLLLVEPRILEDLRAAHYRQAPRALLVPHSADRPVHRVGDLAAREDRDRGLLHGERGPVRVHEIELLLLAAAGVVPRASSRHPLLALLRALASTRALAHHLGDGAVEDPVRD